MTMIRQKTNTRGSFAKPVMVHFVNPKSGKVLGEENE